MSLYVFWILHWKLAQILFLFRLGTKRIYTPFRHLSTLSVHALTGLYVELSSDWARSYTNLTASRRQTAGETTSCTFCVRTNFCKWNCYVSMLWFYRCKIQVHTICSLWYFRTHMNIERGTEWLHMSLLTRASNCSKSSRRKYFTLTMSFLGL